MEIVSEPDMRSRRGGRRLHDASCARSCAISAPATATWRRARCAATSTSRCAEPGDDARHALRDQERQLDPLRRRRRSSTRRGARSRSGGRRRDRAGDAAVRHRARGETRSMRSQGGGARLPLLPRPRPAAAGAGAGCGRGSQAACPSCPTTRRRASSRDYGLSAYDAGVLVAEKATADYFEAVAQGPRRQAGGELGDRRPVRPPEQGRQAHRRAPVRRRAARRAARPDRRQARSPAGSPRTCSR